MVARPLRHVNGLLYGRTMAKKFGYARVSTLEQNPGMQVDALRTAGCDPIYVDKAGGTKVRPELTKLLGSLREGDTVTVWKLDRLGRSLRDLLAMAQLFREQGVHLRSLTEGIDTTTATGELVFHVFAVIAEFERALLRERTAGGLAHAKALGRVGGRTYALPPETRKMIVALYKSKTVRPKDICDQFEIAKSTLLAYVREADEQGRAA